MAATLRWDGPRLMLGIFKLATVQARGRFWTHAIASGVESKPYASVTRAMEDAEDHVKRSLRFAGVEAS